MKLFLLRSTESTVTALFLQETRTPCRLRHFNCQSAALVVRRDDNTVIRSKFSPFASVAMSMGTITAVLSSEFMGAAEGLSLIQHFNIFSQNKHRYLQFSELHSRFPSRVLVNSDLRLTKR